MPTAERARDADRIREIRAMLDGNDLAGAVEAAAASFPNGVDDHVILCLLAQTDLANGRIDQALARLTRAQALAGPDAKTLNDIGICLSRLGAHEAAMDAFNQALSAEPGALVILCNAASAALGLGDLAKGRSLYERAAMLHPGESEPLSALAALCSGRGEVDQARAYARRALAADPGDTRAALALAESDVQDRAFAQAEWRLRGLLAGALPDHQRARAHGLLADALDGLDRFDEAYAAYAASKATTEPGPAAAETLTARAQRLIDHFAHADPAPWRETPGPDVEGERLVAGHVFLLGFPRSGTTLLEQALASHQRVVSLEESSALAPAFNDWLGDNASIDRLAAIGADEARTSRAEYWRQARRLIALGPGDRILVDKLPLHTLSMPLIAKLFPRARVILARRDPRDVVFSCFRRWFGGPSTAYPFATLMSTAGYYDQVMRLAEIYLEQLPPPVHVIRHEDLVADFQREMSAVLAFIGLDWQPSVLAFAARARAGANTPSATQVARGLNAEGVGHWRRYERQIAEAMPLLEPWVRRFGYPMDAAPAPASASPPPAASPDAGPSGEAVLLREAQAAVQQGDWRHAFDAADAAMRQGLTHPLFFKLRGVRREQQGHLDLAIEDFERALAATPEDFAALSALGLCLARAGRLTAAMARLDAAMALKPDYAPIHFNRGWTFENQGDLASARRSFERAAVLDPNNAQAFSSLASLAVRASRWKDAKALGVRALAIDPGTPAARIAVAQAELGEGAVDFAELRLRDVLSDRQRPSLYDRSVAFAALGDVLDRAGKADEAFEAYARANEGVRTLQAPRFTAPGADTGAAFATRLIADFAQTTPDEWRRRTDTPSLGAPQPAAGHVFVLGFPRSGTTLLGQVLTALADVVTLDEKETLIDASQALLGRPGDLARLAAADEATLEPHRATYWRRIAEAGVSPEGRVLVDKLPMNTLGLPLIARLFPAAKIVFMRRDPRDVVLSCFRRQFVIGPSTWEMLTLEGAARFYDAVMRLADAYMAKLDIDVRIQRHEDLLADFDGEARALCAFLDVEWSESMADFAQAADLGAIATPSAAQIASGLNAEGVGQWRRYRDHLAPVLPLLAPWAERFGYPAE